MANWNDPQPTKTGFGASPSLNGEVLGTGVTFDAGLRKHMLAIYNYMASGVLLSGIVALLFANSGLAAQVLATPLRWVIMLAPLGFVFAMSLGANRMATSTLQLLFWGFCTVMGLSMSSIFLVFTASSIASTFFATAGAFAGLSLFGYTTKKSLSGMGSFMVMGLIGILIAMLINIFLQSSALQLAISILGVVIFAGLTAWDTQRLKQEYYMLQGTEFAGKAVVLGALTLYLDFINMFQFLLSFLGNRE
ncbi:Bax inhibitor-1/YccA family protein [Novosphingobium ginsenosidimutans]|uniref:Bax inhibitor-1/YccA family protein n=1 Tax=Novosphingobium ginsenosidimutans TaxID=1176536 RepID=A0A5B8S168_9SPHN|nr:Bax inhibitor-1/YccA family protein [Novosphingobium ginsenosidimutans]QEA14874.1 Bax inhibitor-1/YccA family protein [Novosphingobium ginsenosidimutans]